MDSIVKLGKITPVLERCIRCAQSISELDHIYSSYKVGSKHTLAERARQLGLSEAANTILDGTQFLNIETLVNPSQKGLTSVKDVELGIQHIIADIISKDRGVLDLLHKLKGDSNIWLETTKARAVKETKVDKKGDVTKAECSKSHKNKTDVESKFENYFSFSAPIKSVKPYQVLAVNRGESLKVLSVKINIPDGVLHHLMKFCDRNWVFKGISYALRKRLIEQSVKDSYTRLIQPLLVRHVRSELTQKAERAAVEVFATNLKRLLLSPPVRGKMVLGIDPGFRNGCKLGITSHNGEVLATDVIYPTFGRGIKPDSDSAACKLRDLLIKYSCELIALGNGTACRETESYLSNLIQSGWFYPLDVKFTIVNEQGTSIYSCSPVAQKEFPATDPNVISAISLARRLQDPLAELVKVEPRHLGVGMYQHDVPEKQLNCTLDEVVVECVSFVGVDVNVASHFLLRRIAGLNSSRAEKIIEWRSTNGSFINRQQLKKVKGIGPKTFEQCAGFIRIIPETAQKRNMDSTGGSSQPKKQKFSNDNTENPLDRTCIHPESYSTTLRFVAKCGVRLEDLGKPDFITKIGTTVQTSGTKQLAEEFGISETLMKLISEGLMETPQHDLRSQFQEPLFRRSVTSLEDIHGGEVLTGRVQNVTHFGTFVDIGVGTDGLVPQSRLRSTRLQLGDRIEVKVISVDINRCRISLDLIRIL
jgi:competence ComEA-like helix-hairpin-helix protein